jgi:hypothetical protein
MTMGVEVTSAVRTATIYKLQWGGGPKLPEERYFRSDHLSDAATRFSEVVTQMDGDTNISACWVHLSRLPDSIYPEGTDLIHWTKTSDERPTQAGYLTAVEAERGD